ncbi:MAG: hypothetical protein J3Q66DRAFT_423445 [Benniella sp.]|nr:MAG: hypothetical protein J3Q66DRAFT_423445 [Benniella sp.]
MSQPNATPPIATDWLSMTVQLPAFRCADDGSKVHIISLHDDVRYDVLWDTTTTSPQDVDETFVEILKRGAKYQAKGLIHVRTTCTTPVSATRPPQEHPQKDGRCLHHAYFTNQQPMQITFAVNALRPLFIPPPLPPRQFRLGAAVKRRASDFESEYEIMFRAMQNMSAADKIEDELEARGLTDQWAMIAGAIKRPRLRAARNYAQHSNALDVIDGITCEMRRPTRMRYSIGRNEILKISHPSKTTQPVKEDSNEKIDNVNMEVEDAAGGSAEASVKEADGEVGKETDGKANEADGEADRKANEADREANEADRQANDEAKEEGQKGDDRNDDSKPEDADDNEKQEQDPSKEKGDDDDDDDQKNREDVDDDEEDDEEGIDLGEEDTEDDEDDEDTEDDEDDEDSETSGRDSEAGSKADSEEESEYSDDGTEEDIGDDIEGEPEEDDTDDSDQWTDVDSEEDGEGDNEAGNKDGSEKPQERSDKQDDKHSDEHSEHSDGDSDECSEDDEEDGDECSEHDETDSEECSTYIGEHSDEERDVYSDSDEFSDEFSDEYNTPGYDYFYRDFLYSRPGYGQTTSHIEESGEDEDSEDTVGDDTLHDTTDSESHDSPGTFSNGHRSPYSISSTSSTPVASPPPSPSSSLPRVHE